MDKAKIINIQLLKIFPLGEKGQKAIKAVRFIIT